MLDTPVQAHFLMIHIFWAVGLRHSASTFAIQKLKFLGKECELLEEEHHRTQKSPWQLKMLDWKIMIIALAAIVLLLWLSRQLFCDI